MLTSLLVPTALVAAAMFFASFLAWMVLPVHFADWMRLEQEDSLVAALTDMGVQPANHMLPGWSTPDEMTCAEYQAKYEQ